MNDYSVKPQVMSAEELEEFLMSDQMPENCMQLSDMDGFLTAIAIGPDMILPSEWMPIIIGDEDYVFENIEQNQAFFGAVINWYNGILAKLRGECPEDYSTCIYEDSNGNPIFSDWAEGFLLGMSLRANSWKPIFNSKEYAKYMAPIIAHTPDLENGGFKVGDDVYNKLYEKLKKNINILSNSVIEIDRFWKQTRKYYQGNTKIGRNDPCFCGSGKNSRNVVEVIECHIW